MVSGPSIPGPCSRSTSRSTATPGLISLDDSDTTARTASCALRTNRRWSTSTRRASARSSNGCGATCSLRAPRATRSRGPRPSTSPTISGQIRTTPRGRSPTPKGAWSQSHRAYPPRTLSAPEGRSSSSESTAFLGERQRRYASDDRGSRQGDRLLVRVDDRLHRRPGHAPPPHRCVPWHEHRVLRRTIEAPPAPRGGVVSAALTAEVTQKGS